MMARFAQRIKPNLFQIFYASIILALHASHLKRSATCNLHLGGNVLGSKTEIKKSSGQIFHATIAYLKENSKIKDKFLKKILTYL